MQINTKLDALHAAAMAFVVEPYDKEGANTFAEYAYYFAHGVGEHDFQQGSHEVPILFQGQRLLEQGWHAGFNDAADMHEMLHCSGCQNENGYPCLIHG